MVLFSSSLQSVYDSHLYYSVPICQAQLKLTDLFTYLLKNIVVHDTAENVS